MVWVFLRRVEGGVRRRGGQSGDVLCRRNSSHLIIDVLQMKIGHYLFSSVLNIAKGPIDALRNVKGPFINLTSCFHMLNFVFIRGVVSFILIAAA